VRRGTTSRSWLMPALWRFQLQETSPHLDCLLAEPVRQMNNTCRVPCSSGRDDATGEHRRRSRATDTAELDAAAALVQLTSLVQSIYSRIAVRHDLTAAQAKLLCIVADNPAGWVTLRSAPASRRPHSPGSSIGSSVGVSPLAPPLSATGAPCRRRRPRPAGAKRPPSPPKSARSSNGSSTPSPPANGTNSVGR